MRPVALVLILLLCSCRNDGKCEDLEDEELRATCIKNREGPTEPTPVPVPILNTVEFRVTGGSGTATVSYTSSIYGTVDTTSRLPWFAFFQTYDDTFFVSLSVFNEFGGTIIAQIFVNGRLLREVRGDGSIGLIISGNVNIDDELGTISLI